MSDKLFVLNVKNVMGIEEAEIQLGRVTIIKGKNGAGKSSVLRALRTLAEGGNAAKIIRNGTDQAEITLETGDMTIKKTLTPDDNKVLVESGGMKLSSSPTFIKDLFGKSFNPINFLTMKDDDRLNEVMSRMPIKVTKAELQELTGLGEIPVNFEEHGLKVLDKVRDMVFKSRTASNTTAKTLKTQTEGMTSAVAVDDVSQADLDAIDEKIRLLSLDKEKLNREVLEITQKHMDEFENAASELRKEYELRIEALRKTTQETIDSEKQDIETKKGNLTQEINQLDIEKQTGIQKHLQFMQGEQARKLIEANKAEIEKQETLSSRYTAIIDKIDAEKERLVSQNTIGGMKVEIADGELILDGIPWSTCNTGKRMLFAVNLAVMEMGTLKLIIIDNAEAWDNENHQAILKIAEELDIKIILLERTEGDLTWENYDDKDNN